MSILAASHRRSFPVRNVVFAGLVLLAACGGEPAELEPLAGPAPRPSTGEAVAEPEVAFDRPPLDLPLLVGEPRAVTLVDAGAAPHSEVRVRPTVGTVQQVRLRQLDGSLITFQSPGQPQQTESVAVGPYESVADTVVLDVTDDGFTYDRWLWTYDISETGRGFENLELREAFTATERSDGVRLLVNNRNDVLGFTVLKPVVPEDQAPTLRTLLTDHILLMALPAEPIGVGAVWTQHAVAPIDDYLFDHNATLTLTELHDDRAVVRFEQVATGRPQEEQSMYIQGLKDYNFRSEGTITFHFDLPVPLYDIKIAGYQLMESQFGNRTAHTSHHIVAELP